MSIVLSNGVTLPDIPADVLAEYPYAIIIANMDTEAKTYPWMISFSKKECVYIPKSILGINLDTYVYTAAACEIYRAAEGDSEWSYARSVEGPGASMTQIMWANQDIYTATAFAIDDNGTWIYTLGDEIYFYNSVHPDRVSIGRSLVDGFATQVQRLTGTTDQINAVQIREKLSTVKASIKIGDVVLPAIPEDVLSEYPYAVICESPSNGVYALYASAQNFNFLPVSLGAAAGFPVDVVASLGNGACYATIPSSTGSTDRTWNLQANGEMQAPTYFSPDSYPVLWSNHDVYEIVSADFSTYTFTPGDVWFSEHQNFNGVWLPKIPEDVLAEYPYAMVLQCDTNNLGVVYRLFVAKNFIAYLIPEILGTEYVGSLATGGYRLIMEGMGEWGSFNEFTGGTSIIPIGESNLDYSDFTKVTVLWANHDIDKITSLDLSTGAYTTGGLYFPPLPSIDTNRVSIGYDLFDSIVEEVQRLSGETDKMNALRAYWKLTTVV